MASDKHNVQIIIQARLLSTRFPRKILKKIGDKSIIEIVFNNCLETGYNTVIAVPFGEKNKIAESASCGEEFMSEGSETDVLSRFYNSAYVSKGGIVVRITSDCPLVTSELIKSCVNYFVVSGVTYLTTTNLDIGSYNTVTNFPDGFDVEVFTYDSLCEANKNAKSKLEREHVTLWIRNNFECCVYNPGKVLLSLDNKYSIDTEDDYFRVSKIIDLGEKVWEP